MQIKLSHDSSEYLFVFANEDEADKYSWLFPRKYFKQCCANGYYNAYCINYDDYHAIFWAR